jgi:hypothetical protein
MKTIYIEESYAKRITVYEEMGYYERAKANPLPINHLTLQLSVLPLGAEIARSLKISNEIKPIIRGVVFAGSKDKIYKNFDERVMFWNNREVNEDDGRGSVYYQNSKFRVGEQGSHYTEDEEVTNPHHPITYVVSESYVMAIEIPLGAVNKSNKDKYIQVCIESGPVDEVDGVEAAEPGVYSFYFKISDIMECPDNEAILFEPFMSQMLDYGYYY